MNEILAISAIKHHGAALGLIICAILAANFLALSGLFIDDPAIFITGLGTDIHNGLPGLPNWEDPNIGSTLQALGHLAAEDWLHFSIPWWNPYSGIGMPLAASQSNYALFFPFVLILHFHGGWLWLRILLQMMSASFTYILLSKLGLCRIAGILAGLMYGCMSSFILIGDAPAATFACLPLLLIGIEQARSASVMRSPMGWSLILIAVAYSGYASFPETAMLANVLGGVWFFARLATLPDGGARRRFGVKFFLPVMLGLLITAPCLVPFAEYMQRAFVGGHAALFATDHLSSVGIAIELFPHIFGPFAVMPNIPVSTRNFADLAALYHCWGNSGGWIGMLPALLAMIAMTPRNKTMAEIRWCLFGWIVAWQARTFGLPGSSFLFNLIYPFRFIAVERYAEPTVDFAVIMLAGFAFDDWLNRKLTSLGLAITLIFTGGLMITALAAAAPALNVLRTSIPLLGFVAVTYFGLVSLVVIITFMLLRRPAVKSAVISLAVLIVLDAVVGFGFSQVSGRRSGRIDTTGVAYLQAHIGLQRIFTLGPIAPSYGAYYGIEQIDHNALPVPRIWVDYVTSKLDPLADPIIFDGNFGIRPQGAMDQAGELRSRLASYENVGVKYIVAPPGKHLFDDIQGYSPRKVFRDDVMDIYQLNNPAPYFSTSGNSCELSANTQSALTAHCPAPAILTRREMIYPGWRASVNGRLAAILPSATIFQSIQLPAGNSTIRFAYTPTHLLANCLAAIAALCVWIGCGYHKFVMPGALARARETNRTIAAVKDSV